MSFTFAIADLHGRFDLLVRAFAEIEAYDPHPHKIVTLGDYVDRGPESRQIIEYLMRCNSNVVCLKGNHEDMMVETLTAPLDPDWWVGNGGGATLKSYGHAPAGLFDASVVPQSHIDWMRALPMLHFDKHRVYVHAGCAHNRPLDEQPEQYLLWYRPIEGEDFGHGDRHVIHGHTPNPNGPERYKNRTNLDTLAWRTGRLVIAVFDDDIAGGPIDFIEVGPGARSLALTATEGRSDG